MILYNFLYNFLTIFDLCVCLPYNLDVIKLIMGEELNKEQITTYVDSVFSKFDVNNSGKLDFAESRGLIRSLVEFFDKDGLLSAEEKANMLAMLVDSPKASTTEEFVNIEEKDVPAVVPGKFNLRSRISMFESVRKVIPEKKPLRKQGSAKLRPGPAKISSLPSPARNTFSKNHKGSDSL